MQIITQWTQKLILSRVYFHISTGIPQFTLLMWGHKKKRGKKKPSKLRLLSSTKGEENTIRI